MVKINGKEVEWDRAPNFVNNVQRKVLWKDEKTGALFAIYRIPKGLDSKEQFPHSHRARGFNYCPKNEEHGAVPKGVKVHKDWIYLHYFDGPDDWDDSDKD
jgi:hypothetical protein